MPNVNGEVWDGGRGDVWDGEREVLDGGEVRYGRGLATDVSNVIVLHVVFT